MLTRMADAYGPEKRRTISQSNGPVGWLTNYAAFIRTAATAINATQISDRLFLLKQRTINSDTNVLIVHLYSSGGPWRSGEIVGPSFEVRIHRVDSNGIADRPILLSRRALPWDTR